MLVFSDALRTSRAQLLAAAIDEGSAGAATLKIYTGPRPAPGAAITDQVLLVALQFTHPCAQSVTGGVLTLKPLAEQMATASGIHAWGRIADRDGDFVADLDVGPPGFGADIEIPANELYEGAMVRINTATFTEP
ncbi:hypothetical protein E4186_13780 [Aeromonas media]|uniref:Uncharacterized protein n=2 Tax=Aeromonas media TaxID=651 RepID=A0AAE7AIP5_AERME|nr:MULTISPECIES: hypothetical protein [Aeromonas]QJT31135.1 hypothetical protein E4186_13780 [Aeromonas media]WED80016.1 hypothetical protein PYU99_13575 [Aeromonas media]